MKIEALIPAALTTGISARSTLFFLILKLAG
jgi:hypothetical protein